MYERLIEVLSMRKLIAVSFALALPVAGFGQSAPVGADQPPGVRVLETRPDQSVVLEKQGELFTVKAVQITNERAYGPAGDEREKFIMVGGGYSNLQQVKLEAAFLVEAGKEKYLVLEAAPGYEGGKLSIGAGRAFGGPCYTVCFFDPSMGLVQVSGVIYRSWRDGGRKASLEPGQNFAGAEIQWMPGTPLVNFSVSYLKRITGNQPGKSTLWLFSGSVKIPVWFSN
jgi:hypothetical protein